MIGTIRDGDRHRHRHRDDLRPDNLVLLPPKAICRAIHGKHRRRRGRRNTMTFKTWWVCLKWLGQVERRPGRRLALPRKLRLIGMVAVSYTHLRAHETD